jgi:hypothetical protein
MAAEKEQYKDKSIYNLKNLGYCLLRNSLVTLGIVGVALGTVAKNKKYTPLLLFSAFAFTGDFVMGYCVACRQEVRDFWEAKKVYDNANSRGNS